MPAPNAVRDSEALSYRARGWTYERIANEMGYANRGGAQKAVKRAIDSSVRETNEEAKSIILTDLNAAKQAVWAVLEANHLVVSEGRVVRLDDTPLLDHDPVLRAVDRLVKIDQEMAKIFGTYAPVKHEVRTIDAIDARLAELAEQMESVGS